MTPADPTTEFAAKFHPAARLRAALAQAPLPWIVRSRPLMEASRAEPIEIGAPARHKSVPIGGWRVWRTGEITGGEFASAPLPRAMLRAEPARIPGPPHGRLGIRPALCLCARRNLLDWATPFTEAEVAAAIGSVHPAALIFDPRPGPASAIPERPGCTDLIYGEATPGMPAPGMAEIRISAWRGWKRNRVAESVPIPDFTAPLTWFANDGLARHGTANGGGLLVGQMVVFDLAADQIWIDAGIWTRLTIGGLGMVEFCLEAEG
ncbi:MAG: hypothetical protein ACREFJ_06775 [Acetobacteraceae bacterium]